jgi:hypothetical protein
MSETLGITVLRNVADHYRENPGSWTTGSGSLKNYFSAGAGEIEKAIGESLQKGCVHTMIRLFSKVAFGEAWRFTGRARAVAERDAIRILCCHRGVHVCKESIFTINDQSCRSAEDAVAYIDAAIEKKLAQPGETSSTFQTSVPEKSYRRELVMASFAILVACVFATVAI